MSSTPILTGSLVVGASATPAALDCPERDGVLYNTDGIAFQIECGTDRNGTFLEPGYKTTFDQCMDLCTMTPECIDVTYHRLESPDTVPFPGVFQCILKNTIGPAVDNPNVWGAKRIASTNSATTSSALAISSSSLASPSSTPSTYPSWNGASYTAKTGATYSIGCGISYTGTSYTGTFLTTSYSAPDLPGCIEICSTTTACVGASFSTLTPENVADECMPFSSGGFRNYSGACQGAMLTSVSPSTCPTMNNTSYTAAGSTEAFRISCNVTFDGTLVAEYALSDVYSCIDICGTNPSACVGTKYVVGVPYSTRYLYNGGMVVDSNGPDWIAILDPMPAEKWKVKAGPERQKDMLKTRGKGKVERNQDIEKPHKEHK